MTITGPDARPGAPGQAMVDAAMPAMIMSFFLSF
jgi:hypothetical protein